MKLFLAKLPFSVTSDGLHSVLSEYGVVASAVVAVNRATGASRGFGFAEFSNNDDALAAIKGLNGKVWGGRRISVCESVKSTKLYVGNIPYEATERDLRALFAPYGDVVEASLSLDQERKSRGSGWLTMRDDDAAMDAMAALQKFVWRGRTIYVEEARTRDQKG